MLLVAIAWVYVVLMVAVVEATSANGTVLGALVTVLLYGVLPLAIVGYLFFSPARRRTRRAADAAMPADDAKALGVPSTSDGNGPGLDPDRRDHAAGDAVTPKREEA